MSEIILQSKSIGRRRAEAAIIGPKLSKEDFVALQLELESLQGADAEGHDSPEGTKRMQDIKLLTSEAPWKIDMDGSGDLLSRIIPSQSLHMDVTHAQQSRKPRLA